jgi:hypothetical protein
MKVEEKAPHPGWGGNRKGSGRKAGSGHGRRVVTGSVTMRPEEWLRLDELRGERSRGEWIAERIRRANA